MKTKENSKEKINKKGNNNIFYKVSPNVGISLIVLVITIIVVIILAVAVVVSIINNNPMSEANRARYQSDRANMQMVLTNTVGKIMAESQETIKVDAKILVNKEKGPKNVVGETTYKFSDETGGKIVFDNKKKEGNDYYTGKKLPVYKPETTWYVDDDGFLTLYVGDNVYSDENKNNTVEIDKNLYNELIKRIEKLENKTTMKVIQDKASNVNIRGDSTMVKIVSLEIPEDCYANIFAMTDLLKNGSLAYNSIMLLKNDTITLCMSGKGGEGYTVQDCLSYTSEFKKGDIISLYAYQSTGSSKTVNGNLIINYFPLDNNISL